MSALSICDIIDISPNMNDSHRANINPVGAMYAKISLKANPLFSSHSSYTFEPARINTPSSHSRSPMMMSNVSLSDVEFSKIISQITTAMTAKMLNAQLR